MSILYGIGTVVLGFVIYWIYMSVKALKDPDVQIATNLRMSVKRYRHYERLYNEYQQFIEKHGVHSAASESKFVEIFKQIDNPNEWRRYQEYRGALQREEFLNKILK